MASTPEGVYCVVSIERTGNGAENFVEVLGCHFDEGRANDSAKPIIKRRSRNAIEGGNEPEDVKVCAFTGKYDATIIIEGEMVGAWSFGSPDFMSDDIPVIAVVPTPLDSGGVGASGSPAAAGSGAAEAEASSSESESESEDTHASEEGDEEEKV